MADTMLFCPHCGKKIVATSIFCPYCGYHLKVVTVQQPIQQSKTILDSATTRLNSWTGEESKVSLNIGSMFKSVLEHHETEEAEEIFIAGTKKTTPSLSDVTAAPVQPWLFSRVFLMLLLVVVTLSGIFYVFGNHLMQNGLIFISSMLVPFPLLIMFFEINVFKNMSVFTVTKIFMVGGVASLLSTMVMYFIFGSYELDIVTAILVGFIEEIGKLVVIAYYVNKTKATHIFNGMLIGAAIGAGFAVFETAGYAEDFGLSVLFLRSFGALGSHTLWSAIIGAALVLVKSNQPLSSQTFLDTRFVSFFLLAVALHAIWDMPLPFPLVQMILLIIVAWITILVLINAGLREVKVLHGTTSP